METGQLVFFAIMHMGQADFCENLFGILRIPPFVNHKGKDVNSDWLADQ